VYAIAAAGERTFVGTPTGIAEFSAGRFARVLAAGAFARTLLLDHDRLLAGTMDDGLIEIPLTRGSRTARPFGQSSGLAKVEQLFSSGEAVYALTSEGVFARAATGAWKRVLMPAGSLLTDRDISALAVDAAHRLWIGYFDRGLDIVDAAGRHATHVEDDHVFCVNRIVPNAPHGATAVATANGLVMFDVTGRRRQVLGRNDGLIAEHVTDIAPFRDGMALATPAGLTFIDAGGVRSLYAFHGLVNNHVYALAVHGRLLLAGTLGGVSLLEGDDVRASFTTANSALKHNWITSAVALGEDPGPPSRAAFARDGAVEWWLGTYGAGVVRMDAAGHFAAGEDASDMIVNPNAMLATDRLVLAGTLGRGLYVMQRGSNRWSAITAGLPSLNVTALAAGGGYVYVGTDNGLVRIPEQRLAR
jgi:ligand-binding sensor domain-containing protein